MNDLIQRIRNIKHNHIKLGLEPVTIDLSTARTNTEFLIEGSSIMVSKISGSCSLRLNEKDAASYDLQSTRGIYLSGSHGAFYRLFITNTAQSGKEVTLIIGKDDDLASFMAYTGYVTAGVLDPSGALVWPATDSYLEATPAHNSATVGATTTAILAANATRCYACITNDSDEEVYLGLGVAAVMNKGIRLNRNGGSYEITKQNLFRGAINGICTSGSKVVCTLDADAA